MKKIEIYLLLILIFTSCKSYFTVNVSTEKISEKKIKTIITTNFPENTIFSISAERIYKRKKNPNYYGGLHYYSNVDGVKDGKIEFTFEVNDNIWINNYNEHRERQLRMNNKEFTEIDYESIKDSIEISIFYSPKLLFSQEDNVKKILGNKGENINGKGTIKIDDVRIFKKSINIYNKFKK
jgi:hypothetical protein